jgi:hypothetical protein
LCSPFALERLEEARDDSSSIACLNLEPDGSTQLRLTLLELIERLAALIPPPRIHRYRYHGVLAPLRPCNGGYRAMTLRGE